MIKLPAESFVEQCKDAVVLDVRSPSEYRHAHLPGAISLPLFSDEERAVVGTAYKQQSREAAIKIGLDFFGPKMRGMVEEVEGLLPSRAGTANDRSTDIFLYCWRGGMRSSAVAWLLNLYGFKVSLLTGGYKGFRNHVLKSFQLPVPFQIIGGYTGSGKTAMLHELERQGETIIDLEAIACHKGSAFGNIDMPAQPTQEMFENRVGLQLYAAYREGKTVWLEDESQRIGHINLPRELWERMRAAPVFFFDIPFEERLQHILQGYGSLDRGKMREAITRISKRLGPMETKLAVEHLQEGRLESCFSILLHYYDKHYRKALHNRQNLHILLHKIVCSSVDPAHATVMLSKPMIHEKPGPSQLNASFT